MTLWELIDVVAPNCAIRRETWRIIERDGMKAGIDYLKHHGGNSKMLETWKIPDDGKRNTTLVKE